MSCDVRTRKAAVVEEIRSNKTSIIGNDRDDNGKELGISGRTFPKTLIILFFVLPMLILLYFLFYLVFANPMLGGSQASPAFALGRPEHRVARVEQEPAPDPAPDPRVPGVEQEPALDPAPDHRVPRVEQEPAPFPAPDHRVPGVEQEPAPDPAPDHRVPRVEQEPAPFPAPWQWRHPLQQDAGLPAGPEQSAPTPAVEGVASMVHCITTAGPITIAVHRDWAPHGAERFLEMVRSGFFSTKVVLFRAVRGFICQTGISGDPAVHKMWSEKGHILDDPQWLDQSVDQRPMKRGYLSFAGGGKNSRGTEFFFSFRDTALGTSPWEVPFGTVVGDDSFQTMDHWYTGYGELEPFGGKAPSQNKMYKEGLRYLEKGYPEIDYITGCNISVVKPRKIAIAGFKTTYEQQKGGSGAAVKTGNTVTVHATGIVQETGKRFWSTKDPGQQPFLCKAGVGQVIIGWDQGLLGMQKGEVRKLMIPPDEGYGTGGFPAWGIPPGATLEFTLEVLSIN